MSPRRPEACAALIAPIDWSSFVAPTSRRCAPGSRVRASVKGWIVESVVALVVTLISLTFGHDALTPAIHPFSRSITTLPAVGALIESIASALQAHFDFANAPSAAPARRPAWKLFAP